MAITVRRGTLVYSSGRTLQTLKYFGVIENVKPGIFRIKKYEVSSQNSIQILLTALALLSLKQKAYYEISELTSVPQMFPFVFDVSYEWAL